MISNNIEAEVLVNGKSIAEYRHDSGRFFIEGKQGTVWALRIKNNNSHRAMVVVGVDGINVINSKPIGVKKDEAGYVIDAHTSTTIKGYRLDDNNVASFQFSKADEAYASKDKKLSGTTGVISVRAYREKEKPAAPLPTIIREDHHHYHDTWWPYNTWKKTYEPYWGGATYCSSTTKMGNLTTTSMRCSTDAHAGASYTSHTTAGNDIQASVSQQSLESIKESESLDSNPFSLGSAWGSKAESKVKEVEFKVGNLLTELTIYYTTREGLKQLGINLARTAQVVFPDHAPGKYCEKPANWVG